MLLKNTDKVKIIQITDTHLFSTDSSEIFGVNSNMKLREVVNKIIKKDISDTDIIILTGDVSQDETIESYKKAKEILEKLNLPVYWIPGNHDNILHIEEVFKNSKNFFRTMELPLSKKWTMLFLNTKLDGSDEGYLDENHLKILREKISSTSTEKSIVIVMHHHPIPTKTPLIDKFILKNRKEFWEIVTGTNVKLVICGHVHGDYTIKHKNILVETAPATCLQWKKGALDFRISNRIGYKTYYFDHYYQTFSCMW